MKIHALLALVVVLVAALVWVGLRSDGSSPQPVSAAQPESPRNTAPPLPLADVGLTDAAPADGRRDVVSVSTAAAAELEAAAKSESETAPIVLFGFVRPTAGVEVPDDRASLVLTDRLGVRTSAEASKDGAYSMSGLAPGKYRVFAGKYGCRRVLSTIELTFAESPKRLDFTLQATTALLVTVTDQLGKSMRGQGLVPVATTTKPGEWIDETTSRKHSSWGVAHFDWHRNEMPTAPGDPWGTLMLDVPLPVFVSIIHHERVIATQEVVSGQTEVNFVLDIRLPLLQTGSLRAHFVDQDSREIADVTVTLDAGSSRHLPRSSSLFVEKLAPGWYELRTQARGFERRQLSFRIEPGIEKDLGNVVLRPEVWVSGRIRSFVPLKEREGFECEPYDPAGDGVRRGNTIYRYAANRDGSFRIPELSRGLYLLKWAGDSESDVGPWARVIDTREGPVEDVLVELVEAVPLVLTSSIADWESVRFRIFDKAGTPLISSRLWSDAPHRWKLAPGEYELEVRVVTGEPIRKRLSIARDPVELEIP